MSPAWCSPRLWPSSCIKTPPSMKGLRGTEPSGLLRLCASETMKSLPGSSATPELPAVGSPLGVLRSVGHWLQFQTSDVGSSVRQVVKWLKTDDPTSEVGNCNQCPPDRS